MTAARVCSDCELNWPNLALYTKCPGCGESTVVTPGTSPQWGPNVAEQKAMDMTTSRQRREQFEAFCEERDRPKIDAEVAKFAAELKALQGVPV